PEHILYTHASTPKTWQKWVFRKNGNVGGVPQSMSIKPWQMLSPVTRHKNFFICGDTVYPGQGIAGVALSGILTYERMK
ncbi:MAG: amine oxidase, partial [Bacteroidia bacterium]|nr:amine oxidase [Bacteroidia bacterium]